MIIISILPLSFYNISHLLGIILKATFQKILIFNNRDSFNNYRMIISNKNIKAKNHKMNHKVIKQTKFVLLLLKYFIFKNNF
jgi:hypothetical protein